METITVRLPFTKLHAIGMNTGGVRAFAKTMIHVRCSNSKIGMYRDRAAIYIYDVSTHTCNIAK